jgi:2-methylfumaryl-CoA isomerase
MEKTRSEEGGKCEGDRIYRPPNGPGVHTSKAGSAAAHGVSPMSAPLEGLRIIDVCTYVAGPSAGMNLAQLGADVIRIDPIGGATDTRRLPTNHHGKSLYWAGLNQGKRSIEIDASTPEGRELVQALICAPGPDAGIVLTNSPNRSWLGYESLAGRRPDVIHVRITGRSDGRAAVDYTVNCEVGLPLVTGPADYDRPVNHVLPSWDLLTGLHAAIAILTAERVRSRTGRGQSVVVSLADVAVATMSHLGFVADVVVNGRARLREGNYLYGSFGCDFKTADDRRVMIVALTERHWDHLVELTGMNEAIEALQHSLKVNLAEEEERYRYRELLAALLRPWFEERTYDQVAAGLGPSHVLWGQYRSVEELVNDPHSLLAESGVMADVDQPGIGVYPTPRSVLDFTGWDEHLSAPLLGSHTDEVLSELLGLSGVELAALRERGIIGGVSG